MANVPRQGGRKHPQQQFIQIDTTNILFICGGAFDGIDKHIEQRVSSGGMGFGASLKEKNTEEKKQKLMRQVTNHDLVKFGIIPELVGRIAVISVLDDLDVPSLVRILIEPKNSLVKQYQALMQMDDIKLTFTEGALNKIAEKAIERKGGARALRSVLEQLLIKTMYEASSRSDVKEVIVDEQSVVNGTPQIIT